MASLFRVDLPQGMSAVKLDSQRRATVQYTVKNVSARPIDGRALLTSLSVIKPFIGPVERGWVKIEGKADRHFDVDQEETFPVTISVPKKSDPGNYTFRLDTVWVDKPDEGDAGPAVSFEVANVPTPPPPLWWLIPVVALVLAAVGVGLWLVVYKKVPDLYGMTLPQATKALTHAKIYYSVKRQYDVKPEMVNRVLSQTPGPGTRIRKPHGVRLQVGAAMVMVPMLIGHSYEEAQALLAGNYLTVREETNPTSALAIVVAQDPVACATVESGSGVKIQIRPRGFDEKTGFSVILKEVGANKIGVIKTVREVTCLGLKEAKDLVNGAPKPIKERIGKDEAELIRGKLAEAGATVEVR